jgi:hypothetical protein
VTQWQIAVITGGPQEATMARKDKGGRSSKKVAAKSLKEKRQAKRDKKAAQADTRKPM